MFRRCSRTKAVMLGSVCATAGVAVLLAKVDSDTFRPYLLSAAESYLNRKVSYDTAALSWGMSPTVTVAGVAIGNAADGSDIFRAGRVRCSIAPLFLLRGEI